MGELSFQYFEMMNFGVILRNKHETCLKCGFFQYGNLMSIVKNLLRIEKMSIRFEDFSKFWETSPSSSLQT